MPSRLVRRAGSLALAATMLAAPALALPPASQAAQQGQPLVTQDLRHDVSAPLREMAANAPAAAPPSQQVFLPRPAPLDQSFPPQPDGAVQTATLGPVRARIGLNFDGVNHAPPNTCGPCAPASDSNGAAGATQFVEWVNFAFAVYDKSTGDKILGPVPGNVLWSGFGGLCQRNNDGDIIAEYDKLANRWVMAQISIIGRPFAECVAVSTSSDATGTYNRYEFTYNTFPDYQKVSVWPDAYYASYNMFNANATKLLGPEACAFDRTAMLAGAPATQQCFGPLPQKLSTILPSDLDGATPPPAGEPNFFVGFGADLLNLWTFHVDFANPSNSTFTGPTAIPVAPFRPACNDGATDCVPQLGVRQLLDSLGGAMMYRFAYRNFGDHESLLVSHSVTVAGHTGVRWYELRSPDTTPAVYQQATFTPDATSRFMASLAMDKNGDIAMGYSVSSGAIHPGIRFTGRVPGDPLNTMETEATILDGGGSESTAGLGRWGDYTSMSIDPVDDCTFWYTNQYLRTTGRKWFTRIASLAFPGCR